MTAISEQTASASVTGASTTAASAQRLRDDPTRLDETLARLGERVAEGALPAAAIAIGDARGLIRRETFTSAPKPLSAESIFFLASVTKPIVATAFMQLVEEGRVGLHQPIVEFEPRLRGGGRELITPWHVLTHTSGIPDIDPRTLARSRPGADEQMKLLVESPLRFDPGTKWEYCSASFYLLTLLIDKLSGISYRRYLDDRLQRPLEMHTTFDPRRTRRPIVAVQGIGVDSWLRRRIVLRFMARAAIPGGGLFGTLEDMTRFGAALLKPRVFDGRHLPLRAQTIEEMAEDQTKGNVSGVHDEDDVPVHHGLGWGKPTLMRDVPGSKNVFSHGGVSGTRLWVDPDAGLVFVFFTNRWGAERAVETETLRGTYSAMEA